MPSYDPARSGAPTTAAWDYLQSQLECCGVASVATAGATVEPAYAVWGNNIRINSGAAELRVPESCCLSTGAGDLVADCTSSPVADAGLIWTADCFDSGANYLQRWASILCIISAVFAGGLIIAAALGICLYYLADEPPSS